MCAELISNVSIVHNYFLFPGTIINENKPNGYIKMHNVGKSISLGDRNAPLESDTKTQHVRFYHDRLTFRGPTEAKYPSGNRLQAFALQSPTLISLPTTRLTPSKILASCQT